MTDKQLVSRIEELELRFLDQENTLDELTRALLKQEQRVRTQSETIQRLEERLKTMSAGSGSESAGERDEIPPHY